MSKKKIILILLVILVVSLGVFGLSRKTENKDSYEKVIPTISDTSISSEESLKNESKENVVTPSRTLKSEEISSEEGSKINIILTIPNREFNITITEGASVYDLLISISQKENVDFGFKNFSGLGFFVDSINGVKSENGKYWIYYINGKKAEEGISNYKLKEGDSILWKLEDEI